MVGASAASESPSTLRDLLFYLGMQTDVVLTELKAGGIKTIGDLKARSGLLADADLFQINSKNRRKLQRWAQRDDGGKEDNEESRARGEEAAAAAEELSLEGLTLSSANLTPKQKRNLRSRAQARRRQNRKESTSLSEGEETIGDVDAGAEEDEATADESDGS